MAEDLDKQLEGMTDEQLMALIGQIKAGDKKPDKPPEKVTVKLSDGTVVEGANQEEVNKLLVARLEGTSHVPERPPEETKPGQPQKPAWNMDEFTKKFLQDPREGLDYVDKAQLGFSTREAVPALMLMVAQLAKKTQELETQRFLDLNEEYQPNAANRKVLEGIIQERGWQPGYQSFQDAFDIAKSRGLIEAKKHEPEKPPEPPDFIPPRTRAKSAAETNEVTELLSAVDNMSDEDVEELMLRLGKISSPKLGR